MAKKSKKQKKTKHAAAAPSAGAAAPATAPAVTVRHYCQGIGDCHLLSFPKADGSVFRMLIDCGIHSSVKGGPAIIDEIVADIEDCDRRQDRHSRGDARALGPRLRLLDGVRDLQRFHRQRSMDGMDRERRRTACRAARQVQGPGACRTSVRQPQARRRAQSQPASVGHPRRAAIDPRLPVRGPGRQGSGRAQRGGDFGQGQNASLSRPRQRPDFDRRIARVCASMCSARRATRSCCSSRSRPTRCIGWRRAAAGRSNAR